MVDRVRCKSKSTFDNPLITNHAAGREGATTVRPGDEFSTDSTHAEELERTGLAEKITGDAADPTDAQVKLRGSQVSADTPAVVTNRKAAAAAPAAKA